jgi:siroheme synthase-like protein
MYFPFYIDIKDKECVVIGGGNTAFRKAKALLEFGAKIKVVAPIIKPEFSNLKSTELFLKKFEISDLDTAFMAIGATDDRNVNIFVSKTAREKNIPVNIVDDPKLCTFFFPAIVKDKDVVASVSSGGKSPLVTQKIKKILIDNWPENIGDINDKMGMLRVYAKEHIENSQRKEFLKKGLSLMLEGKTVSLFEIIKEGGYENNKNRDKKKPPCNETDQNDC